MTYSFTTRRLLVREFQASDAATIYSLSLEEGIRQWLPDQVYSSIMQAETVLEALGRHYLTPELLPHEAPLVLAVCHKESSEVIGHVGLSPHPTHGLEIGYGIADAHQKQGFATELVQATLPWGSSHFGVSKAAAVVASENVGSWRVLERAGFCLVKEARSRLHGVQREVRTYVWTQDAGPVASPT